MSYNFDEIIDRRNTDCLKHDFMKERHVPEDVISLWVADMDFRACPEIISALHDRVEHGIYGYTNTKDDFHKVVCDWFRKNHGWDAKEEWLVKTPGVVFALSAAIRAFTNEGDGVLIQQPVYYPFMNMIIKNNRRIVNNSLVYDRDKLTYTIDFDDFEKKIKDNNVKLFILCNPHNPVGRVWKKEELLKIDEICRANNVLVCADEIHCDFVWGDNKHIPYATLSKETEDNCIVCTAPSKTFNLAGLQYSSIFIPNEEIRRSFKHAIDVTGYDEPSVFGVTAAKAAYEKGEGYLNELRAYIWDNIEYMRHFLEENMPEVKMINIEGTYLTWVDCSGLGLSDKELNDRVLNKAKLWLDAGRIFGSEGEQFQRFNVACPREILTKALEAFLNIR